MINHAVPTEEKAIVPEKRILVFAGDFSRNADDRWIIDDIVDALVGQGSRVDVVVFDNKRPRPRGASSRNGDQVRIFSVGPERAPRGRLAKAWSYFESAVLMHTWVYRIIRRENYDLALFTSIGILSAGLPARLRASGIVNKLLFILWDFFPVHQLQIGRLPANALTKSLRLLEFRAFATADVVAVMSPANVRFLRAYHPGYCGEVIVLPPWAQSPAADYEPDQKSTRFTAIFGGQLVAGRGVETLLEAAQLLKERKPTIRIIVAGDGPLRPELEEKARALAVTNVEFVGALPRPAYRELLRTAHVGVAATVAGVTVPSYPSKIVEYFKAALPVIACLESSTDAGELIERAGAGFSVLAHDAEALANALERMEEKHRSGQLAAMAEAAGQYFTSSLSDTRAALTILEACAASSSRTGVLNDDCESHEQMDVRGRGVLEG